MEGQSILTAKNRGGDIHWKIIWRQSAGVLKGCMSRWCSNGWPFTEKTVFVMRHHRIFSSNFSVVMASIAALFVGEDEKRFE
jgi:hypothetical protein